MFLDPSFDATAEATSGLPVAYWSEGNCNASASGTVELTGAGSCTIYADQAGSDKWNSAPTASRTFLISKAPSHITFENAEPPWFRGFEHQLNAMNSNGTSLDYRLTPNSDSDCGLDGSTLTFGDWGSLSADCYVEAFQSVEHADYHTPSPVVAWIMVDYVFISISIDNPDRQARFGTEETVTAREPSGNIQSAYFSVTGDSCHFGNGQKFTELAANAAKTYTFSVTLFIDPPPPGTTADTCTVRIEANPDDKWASGSDDQATATFTITGG